MASAVGSVAALERRLQVRGRRCEDPICATALRAGSCSITAKAPSGTVAVRRLTGSTSLAIDGKVDASNSGDMLTQRLLAHVPLLLHPNPKRVAILGLGSGVTLGIGA